jgi:hypothetical protein
MDLGDHIIKTIKTGDVKMRPKWYFLLRDILGATAIVIILLIAVYVGSFIIFVLHQDGTWFVPVFGFAGWFALFNALPWVLIVLSCLFVVALAFLVMRYPFSYKWPVVYSFLGIGFLIAAASFLFVQTSFSNTFFSSPIPEGLPFLGEYYPGVGVLSPNNVHRGEIEALTSSGFVVEGFFGTTSTVFIASQTDMMFAGPFEPGDVVVVFGNRSVTGTIQAVGIEKIGQ